MTEWSVWKESTEDKRTYICLFLRQRDKQSVFSGESKWWQWKDRAAGFEFEAKEEF